MDSGVDLVNKGDQLRHRGELRPNVRRQADRQVADADRLLDDRVNPVGGTLFRLIPGTSQTSSGPLSPPTLLFCVCVVHLKFGVSFGFFQETTRRADDFPTFGNPAIKMKLFGGGVSSFHLNFI